MKKLKKAIKKLLIALGWYPWIPFSVRFDGLKNMKFGKNVVLGRFCWLAAEGGFLEIGADSFVSQGSVLNCYGGKIRIGERVSIQIYCFLNGYGNITIGNDVMIATGVVINAGTHIFLDKTIPMNRQGVKGIGIVIEDDVWIGAKAVILDGVRIGHGAIVGAGAVVTKNVLPFTVVAGVPAVVIKER